MVYVCPSPIARSLRMINNICFVCETQLHAWYIHALPPIAHSLRIFNNLFFVRETQLYAWYIYAFPDSLFLRDVI